MAKKSKVGKSLARKKFAFALSQHKTEEAQKIARTHFKGKAAPTVATKAKLPSSKQAQALKGGKAEAGVKGTKESEPFKPKDLGFQESNYERLREWIERSGLGREDVEEEMQNAGQPMTTAQQQLLDDFEAAGLFGDVEVEDSYEYKRLTA